MFISLYTKVERREFMRKNGFTLLEMLIVIAVISVMVLIFAPNSSGILNKGNADKTSANLKGVGSVMFQYGIEHQGLPLGSAITTADPVVISGIKSKLIDIGSIDPLKGSTSGTVDADYATISSHFKAIDNTKLATYGQNASYEDYFIIDDTSPKMAGYVVSYKKLNAVNQTGQAIQFIEPDGIFVDAANAGTSTPVLNFSIIRTLSQGLDHTLAIKQDGTLWSWGANAKGQLGLSDTTPRNVPTQVGIENTWVSVSASNLSDYAIKQDGSLWSWGDNNYSQLGLGDATNRYVPTRIGTENSWTLVASGDNHAFAIKQDGSLWIWGYNGYGQLGLNDTAPRNVPTRLGIENTWKTITGGAKYTLAIKQDGSLWSWGANAKGQLGLNDKGNRSIPVQVGTETTWASISATIIDQYSLAIKQDGSLWSWGYNCYGQLGLNDQIDRLTPTQVGIENTWVSMTANDYNALAIKQDGSLWSWGYNGYGQLGLNDTTNRLFPTRVGIENGWKSASANNLRTLAIKQDGSLWGWGMNSDGTGQLGIGDTIDHHAPTQVGIENTWK
jgi:prepilin-type N-terminal cleavage/methylation domain-containing protein